MDVHLQASSHITLPVESQLHWNIFSSPHYIFNFCWSFTLPFMFISTEPSLFPRVTAPKDESRAMDLLQGAADARSWDAQILAEKCQIAASISEDHSAKSGDV